MAPGKRASHSQLTPLSKRQCAEDEDSIPTIHRRFRDTEIWKEAPILKGTTKFEPLPDTKNILITGGAGFIACWLVRHLTLTYPDAYNIVSFDKLDYCASLNNTRSLSSSLNFTFVHGDITSPTQVQDVLRKHKIDTIFHFAALSHVDLSFGNSYEFTNTNVYGTHVLLECAKNHGMLKKFVHVSTDEVYGEVGADEDDLVEGSILAPTNPYAASKAAAEMLVHSYWKSFKLPIIVVRSNNIYGPHQYPEKIIPKFALLLHRQSKLTLHGDGLHTRRYLYAADAADAFDTILHRGTIGAIYNVGSTDEISNIDLCKLLITHFGNNPNDPGFRIEDWVDYTKDRPFNDRRYAVDATKLKGLGWEQRTEFGEGVKATIEWYKSFGDRWWGDVSAVLGGPFPVVKNGNIVPESDLDEIDEKIGSSLENAKVTKKESKDTGLKVAENTIERVETPESKTKSARERPKHSKARNNYMVQKSGSKDIKRGSEDRKHIEEPHYSSNVPDYKEANGVRKRNGISVHAC
ncbi:uncharacterized protein H6S33_001067 [Morchella sextelata]|uniref:uncharacterized protein n=1 Tax=Morchella sextelata TaxID=1174677 RepID=UPI001D04CD18|nr:uncharacterized protein H6S33_001067 [Morchella sextelata]KAH0608839.1 hypothetical protein H6S33_001067 [Morchella sextelata]